MKDYESREIKEPAMGCTRGSHQLIFEENEELE
jgi:hypothetical protein